MIIKFTFTVVILALSQVPFCLMLPRDPLDKPNIIILVADDMGYGDLSSYGHPTQESGPIDRMALEGIRFTQWYSPESVCTPSRGATLTGRLPVRVGLYGPYERVFIPHMPTGLPKNEITIAEALKDVGYATGMNGKWHLGINEFRFDDGNHLPAHHGFDEVGTIAPFTHHARCDEEKKIVSSPEKSYCFFYSNDTIIQQPAAHHNITKTLVYETKAFIYNHENEPFFYMLNFLHLHDSLFAGPEFQASSKRGEYGDNLNEMSWAVGEILDTLRKLEIEKNTLVLFISDHGGHIEICSDGGKNSPFRGSKETTWEGGFRVPAIAWWPSMIEGATVSRDIVSSLDIFSTALDLAGAPIPSDRVIDGISLKEHFLSSGRTPHSREVIHYYCSDRLMAIRHRDYKAHFYSKPKISLDIYSSLCYEGWPSARSYSCYGCHVPCIQSHELTPLLFNLERDPGELYPLKSRKHKKYLHQIWQERDDHIKNLVKGEPLFTEPATMLLPCCNPPYCFCNYSQDQ
ncbi:arylsulfatase-like isoform X2 [Apostichopus japonicus]